MNARQFIARCFNTTTSDHPSSAPPQKATPLKRTSTFDFIKHSSATVLDNSQLSKIKGGEHSENDIRVVDYQL